MTTTSNTHLRVPFGLSQGDKVKFRISRDSEDWRTGTITDILSTQFIIVEDDLTHITHFDNVRLLK